MQYVRSHLSILEDPAIFRHFHPAASTRCRQRLPGGWVAMYGMFQRSFIVAACISVLLLAAGRSSGQTLPGLEPKVGSYFQQYCVGCHGADKQKGDFRLDVLSPKVGIENNPQWLEVMTRISSGEMPPKKAKARPSEAESVQIVEWLSTRMKEGETARMAARPLVSYNRLSRDEYVNTVRDLLGVHFDATDPGAFFDDPEWHGFERLGSVLTLSPSHVEKYLAAAETLLEEACPTAAKSPPPVEVTSRIPLTRSISEAHRTRLEGLGLLDKVRYEVWPHDQYGGSAGELPALEPGVYEITYTLSGLRPPNGRAPRLFVYESRLDRLLYEQDIIAPEEKPMTVTFRRIFPRGGRRWS